jgi:hypothetical protein
MAALAPAAAPLFVVTFNLACVLCVQSHHHATVVTALAPAAVPPLVVTALNALPSMASANTQHGHCRPGSNVLVLRDTTDTGDDQEHSQGWLITFAASPPLYRSLIACHFHLQSTLSTICQHQPPRRQLHLESLA